MTPPLMPPMRIVIKGLFVHRELSKREAEAYHLRKAAELVGQPKEQAVHLQEAERNRFWDQRLS